MELQPGPLIPDALLLRTRCDHRASILAPCDSNSQNHKFILVQIHLLLPADSLPHQTSAVYPCCALCTGCLVLRDASQAGLSVVVAPILLLLHFPFALPGCSAFWYPVACCRPSFAAPGLLLGTDFLPLKAAGRAAGAW